MQDYLPLAGLFLSLAVVVFFIALIAYEVIHLIHSSGWHWKRSANGYLEAFVFVMICIPVVEVTDVVANWMCHRFDMRHSEEIELHKFLCYVILLPLLVWWNGRRWVRLRDAKNQLQESREQDGLGS